ncbi:MULTISPECIES: TIGR02569 family protein [Actinoalloteichus]|uniref:TIGR02569 family protein n=1 Tax=Actinoalloteichus caeruleus DSM 43889 TaxID=1120930 RepID=A0ABT1JI97_ACTCY|nr:TIGR02569 family protein [Actinoalloteichus caeruleus]MCP2332242.1 TIGR02569 family protein [Actinoalloteichus caeruleus DSM 43889]
MSVTPEPPPLHVRAAFGARDDEPEPLDPAGVWRCGEIVLRPVSNPAEAAWAATILGALHPDDLRLSRSVRSSDGRWVVSGWAASRFLTGQPEARHDEVVAVSLRLHDATAGLARPRFLDERRDVFSVADRMAWGEEETTLDPDRGGRLFEVLLGSRRHSRLRAQVVHGDLFGNVLFSRDSSPGVIDFTPYWRPAEWAAAVVVVDGLAWGGADPGLIRRWSHLPEWEQSLLHALLFRLAVNALHPRSTPQSLAGLERATQLVLEVL